MPRPACPCCAASENTAARLQHSVDHLLLLLVAPVVISIGKALLGALAYRRALRHLVRP